MPERPGYYWVRWASARYVPCSHNRNDLPPDSYWTWDEPETSWAICRVGEDLLEGCVEVFGTDEYPSWDRGRGDLVIEVGARIPEPDEDV